MSPVQDRRSPVRLPVAVGAVVLLVSFGRVVLRTGRTEVRPDSAFYEHAGWYVLTGARPYVDFWDPKPPLNFEITALTAALGGGDPQLIHAVNLLMTAAAVLASAALAAHLVWDATDDRTAGIVTGVALFTLPGLSYLAVQGYRPKYAMLALGLGALVAARTDRWALAGGLGAASAATWQGGAVFWLLPLGMAVQRLRTGGPARRTGGRFLSGTGVAVVVVLVPMVLLGVTRAMLVQTLLGSTMGEESILWFRAVRKGFEFYNYAFPVVGVGVLGAVAAAWRRPGTWWWVVVGGAAAAFQVFRLDFDGPPDLFLGHAFVIIGVGLAAHELRRRGVPDRTRAALAGLLVAVVLVQAVTAGGSGLLFASQDVWVEDDLAPEFDTGGEFDRSDVDWSGLTVQEWPAPGANDEPYRRGTVLHYQYSRVFMKTIYWNQLRPQTCHYRVGAMHRLWLLRTGGSPADATCGDGPSLSDVLSGRWSASEGA